MKPSVVFAIVGLLAGLVSAGLWVIASSTKATDDVPEGTPLRADGKKQISLGSVQAYAKLTGTLNKYAALSAAIGVVASSASSIFSAYGH